MTVRIPEFDTDLVKSADRLWHQRLTHANRGIIKTMLKSKRYGMKHTDGPSAQDFLICLLTKLAKTS